MTRTLTLIRGFCPKVLLHILSACAVVISLSAMSANAQDLDRGEVEKIVREYLLENPEIIAEALTELQQRQEAAEEAARLQALKDNEDILFDSNYQVVLGNPEGSVTLVEFFDYNCGFCKRAYGDMVKLIEDNPDLRVVLKEFPVLGQASLEAARVAIAVNSVSPDKYAEFHETLLLGRGQANLASALSAAVATGIEEADLMAAMETDEAQKTLEEVDTIARQLGLSGTPSYVIGNQVIPGALGHEYLSALIAEAKGCAETTC